MATHKIAPPYYTREQAIMITLGVNPKTYWIDAPIVSTPQMTYQQPQMGLPSVQPQIAYQQQPQMGLPSVGQFGMNSMSVDQFSNTNTDGYFSEEEDEESQD
jgi:hypothetical protein